MSDVTITRRPTIRAVLLDMQPYVIFKRAQVERGSSSSIDLPRPGTLSGTWRSARLWTGSQP
jgi:hypothetical protein